MELSKNRIGCFDLEISLEEDRNCFGIHRKSSTEDIFIDAFSFCPSAYKRAAFGFLFQRVSSLSLSSPEFAKEVRQLDTFIGCKICICSNEDFGTASRLFSLRDQVFYFHVRLLFHSLVRSSCPLCLDIYFINNDDLMKSIQIKKCKEFNCIMKGRVNPSLKSGR